MARPLGNASEGARFSIPTGIDVIGDLAIVKLPEVSPAVKRQVAEKILREMKKVRGVFEQEGGIAGEYRLRSLKHIGGENRTMTLHRENGCSFRVDIAKVYFSPRLSTERLIIANMVEEGERVLNMFAGVGPFSIAIARRRREAKVTSCEVNRFAYNLHLENNLMNKVAGRINTINADAATLPSRLRSKFDRILMPHPSGANRYIGTALSLLDDDGVIHYYRHLSAADFEEARSAILDELREVPGLTGVNVRRVREVGPRLLEVVADLRVSRN
jgi:tRNA (guanine37-N1)-methyltransferase